MRAAWGAHTPEPCKLVSLAIQASQTKSAGAAKLAQRQQTAPEPEPEPRKLVSLAIQARHTKSAGAAKLAQRQQTALELEPGPPPAANTLTPRPV